MSQTIQKAIPVKLCYSHIGGRLGSMLTEHYVQKGWIKQSPDNERLFYVTVKGKKCFTELGLDLSIIPEEAV